MKLYDLIRHVFEFSQKHFVFEFIITCNICNNIEELLYLLVP